MKLMEDNHEELLNEVTKTYETENGYQFVTYYIESRGDMIREGWHVLIDDSFDMTSDEQYEAEMEVESFISRENTDIPKEAEVITGFVMTEDKPTEENIIRNLVIIKDMILSR